MPHSRRPSPTSAGAAHPSQRGRGDRSGSAVAVTDAPARQIVRAHRDAYPIAKQDADAEFAHLAASIRQQLMPVVELDFELGIGQRIDDCSVHLDGVVLGHAEILTRAQVGACARRRTERKEFLAVVSSGSGACGAALCLEAVGAVDGLIATGLEGDAGLTVATSARGDEHLAAWRRGEAATAGITGRSKQVETPGLRA